MDDIRDREVEKMQDYPEDIVDDDGHQSPTEPDAIEDQINDPNNT